MNMKTFRITAPDEALRPVLQNKIDNLNKPKGSMGRLEELALQIGLIQHTLSPELRHPCHLLFGADHGIERERVSISPREITWQQMINFSRGGGGVNLFCRQHGFELFLIDMGVDYDLHPYPGIIDCKVARGTRNFLHEAAMTEEETDRCIETGARMVTECHKRGCNVVSIGEMGIGNTSPSSIWMHLLTGTPLEMCVGAGAGLDNAGIRHKYEVLQSAVQRFRNHHPDLQDADVRSPRYATEVLRWFGGFEMTAAIGAMLRAAELGMVILVDGFIMTACMLMASRLYPAIRHYAVFCHEGDEAGHRRMLEALHARGLLQIGLRLGEGTGALCAYPLLQSAVRMLNEMNNFKNAHITKYF